LVHNCWPLLFIIFSNYLNHLLIFFYHLDPINYICLTIVGHHLDHPGKLYTKRQHSQWNRDWWLNDGWQNTIWSYLASIWVVPDMEIVLVGSLSVFIGLLWNLLWLCQPWSVITSLLPFTLHHDLTISALPQCWFIDLSASAKTQDWSGGYSKDIHSAHLNWIGCCSTHLIQSYYDWFIFF